MKKTIIILAIILLGINVTSCTQDTISEEQQAQELSTTGEDGEVVDERDDG